MMSLPSEVPPWEDMVDEIQSDDYDRLDDFDLYQNRALETAIYPASYHIMYPAMGLSGEVGEVLNKIKKIYRDRGGEVRGEDRVQLQSELGDVLWYLAVLAEDLNISLSDIAEDNLAKLAARRERGTIGGSGDSR